MYPSNPGCPILQTSHHPGCPILRDSLTVVKGGVFVRKPREPLSAPASLSTEKWLNPDSHDRRAAKIFLHIHL